MSEWIEWKGGKMPIDNWTKVQVRLADRRLLKRLAHNLEWDHQGDYTDIIAYRIVEQSHD